MRTRTRPPSPTFTPRVIVALLTVAGHARSDYHRPGVPYSGATTGFRIWRTASRDNPEVPVLAVAHYDAGQHGGITDRDASDAWAAHVRNARLMLGRYAAVIEDGGYQTQMRFAATDPYLVVTGREEGSRP